MRESSPETQTLKTVTVVAMQMRNDNIVDLAGIDPPPGFRFSFRTHPEQRIGTIDEYRPVTGDQQERSRESGRCIEVPIAKGNDLKSRRAAQDGCST